MTDLPPDEKPHVSTPNSDALSATAVRNPSKVLGEFSDPSFESASSAWRPRRTSLASSWQRSAGRTPDYGRGWREMRRNVATVYAPVIITGHVTT
jgi:hypothetical protein